MQEKILIIGGVALGPKVACRAKRLNPNVEITMLEQGQYISYGGCGIPYYISAEVAKIDELRATGANIIRDADFFEKLKGVNVRTLCRATKIDPQKKQVYIDNLNTGQEEILSYNKLVIATGSTAFVPDIPGKDLEDVSTVLSLEEASAIRKLCDAKALSKVCIVGAGFIGLEMAVALASQGIKVTVVEFMDRVLPSVLSDTMALMAKHDLEAMGIDFLLSEKVEKLEAVDGKLATVVTNKRTFATDFVIFSVGVRPNSKLAAEAGIKLSKQGAILVDEFMRTSDKDIYAGGDVVSVKNLITGQDSYLPLGSMANRQGRVIGTNLVSSDGMEEKFTGVVGSWCVKLNKLSAVGTGLTVNAAKSSGFAAIAVNTEQLDRAHFYPHKDYLSLEVVAEEKTRRLLGVQGLSPNGDSLKSRIDSVAAMLQFSKPSISDLSNLELAYSPPLASAMDAINAAANVTDNVLRNQHKAINPREFANIWHNDPSYIIIDARPIKSSKKMAEKHPTRWLAIPLEEIKQRLNEIPKDKKIALICNSGLRAFESQLILRQAGFDSLNSLGGMQALSKTGLPI